MNSISTSRKKKFAYSIIAVALLCYFFVIAPLRTEHANLRSELAGKTAEVGKYEKQIKEIEQAMAATSRLYTEWQEEVRKLAQQEQVIPNVQEEVAKQATAVKLNIESIQSMPDIKVKGIVVGTLKVSANGSYTQILRFINALTNANRLIRIVNLSLEKVKESEDKTKAKNGVLKTNLILEFYKPA